MLVLGIDPGSNATGYAAIERQAGRYLLREAGVIRTKVKDPIPTRLQTIFHGILEAVDRMKPGCMAIESIFQYRSAESAIRLGQARGVALLAAAERDLEIYAYNPMTIKKSVGGHGRASKPQMITMVSRLVGAAKPLPSDAADAAAIAITHLVNQAFAVRMGIEEGEDP